MRRIGILGIVAVLALAASTARADVDFAYVSDVASTTLGTGQQITINLYLEEHTLITKGQQSILLLEGNGLFAGGLKVQRTAGDAGSTFANSGRQVDGSNVATVWSGTFSGAPIAGGGSNPSQSLVSGTITNGGAVNGFTLNATKSTATDVYRDVLLGSMTITAGIQTTNYTLGAKSTLNSNTVTFTNRVGLDNDNGTSPAGGTSPFGYVFAGARDLNFAITIAAVPEPSSMALCGAAAISMGFVAWRRRNKKLADAAAAQGTPAAI